MASFHTNTRSATTPSQQNISTTFKSQVELASAATGRGQIFELNVGADGPPNATDCQIIYDCSRKTVVGTGVTGIINPMNPADPAARTTCIINSTIEPTVTANSMVWSVMLNQRASQRWIAAPGYELIWPNTSANGLTCRALSPTYAAPVGVAVYFTDL